jgi:hypothetical protein
VVLIHVAATVPVKSQSLWRGMHCARTHVMHVRQNMARKAMVALLRSSKRLRAAIGHVRLVQEGFEADSPIRR